MSTSFQRAHIVRAHITADFPCIFNVRKHIVQGGLALELRLALYIANRGRSNVNVVTKSQRTDVYLRIQPSVIPKQTQGLTLVHILNHNRIQWLYLRSSYLDYQ